MRIEFTRPDQPDKVVAAARWDGTGAVLEHAEDPATGAAVMRIFRAAPVVSDDASLRTLSGRGESVVEPGSLEWFREAALRRAPKVGLAPRFVAAVRPGEGFDPASQYRSFQDQVERMAAGNRPAREG